MEMCAFTDCLPSDFVGEYVPYTQLSYDIIPALKERGMSDDQIEQLTVANPRQLFESLERGGY